MRAPWADDEPAVCGYCGVAHGPGRPHAEEEWERRAAFIDPRDDRDGWRV